MSVLSQVGEENKSKVPIQTEILVGLPAYEPKYHFTTHRAHQAIIGLVLGLAEVW